MPLLQLLLGNLARKIFWKRYIFFVLWAVYPLFVAVYPLQSKIFWKATDSRSFEKHSIWRHNTSSGKSVVRKSVLLFTGHNWITPADRMVYFSHINKNNHFCWCQFKTFSKSLALLNQWFPNCGRRMSSRWYANTPAFCFSSQKIYSQLLFLLIALC